MKNHGPVTILDVLEEDVLADALRCISRRKGSPGIDGIRGEDLIAYWEANEELVKKRLLHGIYRPLPVFAIKIPKPDSDESRRIEIPCAIDRMLQTAMLTVLRPCFEATFLPSNYAFRRKGGCHKALEACLRELQHSSAWIIDLDIRHFFDKVDHGILLSIIRKTIRDKRLLHLITAYIQVDVRYRHSTHRKRRGLSQGGPLSPLLANIYLNELDQYLARIGTHYVRYADDMLLFCDTKEQAENLLATIRNFLKESLRLSLNEEKTKIVRPWEVRFLGYSFLQEFSGDCCGTEGFALADPADAASADIMYSLVLNAKTEAQMLRRMKKNIRRSLAGNSRSRKKPAIEAPSLWERLGGFNRGWIQYFQKVHSGSMTFFLEEAEHFQVTVLTEELRHMKKKDRCSLLNALYSCRTFSTLTGWYALRFSQEETPVEHNEPDERRSAEQMANKYCFWRSGSFYPFRTALYKAWDAYTELPFFAERINGECPTDFRAVQSEVPWRPTPIPALSDRELCALGIIAAGKSMTSLQLAAFLKMKSINLPQARIQEMLTQFVRAGLVERISLYPAPRTRRPPFAFPTVSPRLVNQAPGLVPQAVLSYRVFGRGKRFLRKLGAPVDSRIYYSGEEDRSVQTARFYMNNVLYNQIILQCMLLCPGFRFFEISAVYNFPEQEKTYVPLFVETEEESYFFWHLDKDTTAAFEIAIGSWMRFYRYRRSCSLVLITASDIVRQMAEMLIRRLPEKDVTDAIFLSDAASWFGPRISRSARLPICTVAP